MARFIGRQRELARLLETIDKPSASFIVVRGLRRVGKSRLHQIAEISRQMASQFATARAIYEDWGDALQSQAERPADLRPLWLGVLVDRGKHSFELRLRRTHLLHADP